MRKYVFHWEHTQRYYWLLALQNKCNGRNVKSLQTREDKVKILIGKCGVERKASLVNESFNQV